MSRPNGAILVLPLAFVVAACSPPPTQSPDMSFFITSERLGNGGDLGGLEAADRHCAALAAAAGSDKRDWRAYLSTTGDDNTPPVHARDRIGTGPWVNWAGTRIADSVAALHGDGNALSQTTGLTEQGEGIRVGIHDILTGTNEDGTAARGATCRNWTSTGGIAMVGHHNRNGGGNRPTSWNAAHVTPGCALPAIQSVGGDARFYCFALN